MQAFASLKASGPTPLELTGGESVYCINHSQMGKALSLVEGASPSSSLGQLWAQVHQELSRNEQAALAFCLIKELNGKT